MCGWGAIDKALKCLGKLKRKVLLRYGSCCVSKALPLRKCVGKEGCRGNGIKLFGLWILLFLPGKWPPCSKPVCLCCKVSILLLRALKSQHCAHCWMS